MRITGHIHGLKIPFQLNAEQGTVIERSVYVYLIYGKAVYLIDTGVSCSVGAIFEYIKETGRDPREISMAILTHSHPDHIGGAMEIKRLTGCMIAAHGAEKPWIEDVELQFKERPVPGFKSIVGGPVTVDHILEEGEVLELEEGLHLEVFHTPGHSRGSVSLLLQEDRALFAGDSIPLSYDAPIYDDPLESALSIKKLKSIDRIDALLSAWDTPKKGDGIQRSMNEGLAYLRRVHTAALKISATQAPSDPMTLCKSVLRDIGLPEKAVNPLAARSVAASLRLGERRDLVEE